MGRTSAGWTGGVGPAITVPSSARTSVPATSTWQTSAGSTWATAHPRTARQYQNNTAGDYGVNNYAGFCFGYAYGANIGWVSFETNGLPRVDMSTGKLSGSIWSANCGWISLSNAVAYVQTDYISSGAPTLYISYSRQQLRDALLASLFKLDSTDELHLTLPADWTPASGVMTINGTNYLTISPPLGNSFFRLANP